MSVRLYWLPNDIKPGEYKLHEHPTMSELAGGQERILSVKFHVDDFGSSAFSEDWTENVTGTLTVESVKNGRMTGHFKFKASQDFASPVTVKGQFEDLVILDGE